MYVVITYRHWPRIYTAYRSSGAHAGHRLTNSICQQENIPVLGCISSSSTCLTWWRGVCRFLLRVDAEFELVEEWCLIPFLIADLIADLLSAKNCCRKYLDMVGLTSSTHSQYISLASSVSSNTSLTTSLQRGQFFGGLLSRQRVQIHLCSQGKNSLSIRLGLIQSTHSRCLDVSL